MTIKKGLERPLDIINRLYPFVSALRRNLRKVGRIVHYPFLPFYRLFWAECNFWKQFKLNGRRPIADVSRVLSWLRTEWML
jgi:hypothetical protein